MGVGAVAVLVTSTLLDISSNNDKLTNVIQANEKAKEIDGLISRKALTDKYSSRPLDDFSSAHVRKNRELLVSHNVTEQEKQKIDRLQLAMEAVVIDNNNDNPSCEDLVGTGHISFKECQQMQLSKNEYQDNALSNISVLDEKVIKILGRSGNINTDAETNGGDVEVSIKKGFHANVNLVQKQKEKIDEILRSYDTILADNTISSQEKEDFKSLIIAEAEKATAKKYASVSVVSIGKLMNVELSRENNNGNNSSDSEGFVAKHQDIIGKIESAYNKYSVPESGIKDRFKENKFFGF